MIKKGFTEQEYIESRLLKDNNFKIFKINEEDVTSFDDGIITFYSA